MVSKSSMLLVNIGTTHTETSGKGLLSWHSPLMTIVYIEYKKLSHWSEDQHIGTLA